MAMVSTSSTNVELAYTDASHGDLLGEILAGSRPMDFHWAKLSFPSSPALATTGFVADLSDSGTRVTFEQVYAGVCNPALTNFNQCWLHERYAAGEPGLTGTVSLRVDTASARGVIDISWAGETDRFGDPVQYHQHGTTAAIDVPVTYAGSEQP